MVVYEEIDGTNLIRAYSDSGHKIVNANGVVYSEAIDPDFTHRKYTESEELLDPEPDFEEDENDELLEEPHN